MLLWVCEEFNCFLRDYDNGLTPAFATFLQWLVRWWSRNEQALYYSHDIYKKGFISHFFSSSIAFCGRHSRATIQQLGDLMERKKTFWNTVAYGWLWGFLCPFLPPPDFEGGAVKKNVSCDHVAVLPSKAGNRRHGTKSPQGEEGRIYFHPNQKILLLEN